MGRAPCCDKTKVKRGPWSPEEDNTLKNYVESYGTGGNWIALPQKAGLKRCGKSCRLRWLNYLRPNIKHGGFTEEEDNVILTLYQNIGSRWSLIASQLPGRTDNDVKNYWNTKLKKKLLASTTTAAATVAAAKDNFTFAPPSSSVSSMETIYSRNSNFEPYFPLMEVNSHQEMMAAAEHQIELPNLVEASENDAYNSSGPLFPCAPLMFHEEALASSYSPQFYPDNKIEDTTTTFLEELSSGLLPYDLLNYLTY